MVFKRLLKCYCIQREMGTAVTYKTNNQNKQFTCLFFNYNINCFVCMCAFNPKHDTLTLHVGVKSTIFLLLKHIYPKFTGHILSINGS